jgi:hypothetical protein
MAPVSQGPNFILIALQILKPRALRTAIGMTRKKTKMPSLRHDFEQKA